MVCELCAFSVPHHPSRYFINCSEKYQDVEMTLQSELVISMRVLELGSGVGFLGIIVASLQQLLKTTNLSNNRLTDLSPGSLWLTDLNDEVLSRCRDNLNLPCSECSHTSTHRLNFKFFIMQRRIFISFGFELSQA